MHVNWKEKFFIYTFFNVHKPERKPWINIKILKLCSAYIINIANINMSILEDSFSAVKIKQLQVSISKVTAWKVSKYGVFSGLYFPVFRLNTGKYGPEKTPYLGTFYAVSLIY